MNAQLELGRRLLASGLSKRPRYGVKELAALDELCLAEARRLGLDPPETLFHLVPAEELYDVASRGLPGRFSHWRFGQSYEQQKGEFDRGRSRIYELVINTRPAHAYLLEGNSLVAQLLVLMHAYAHVAFFERSRYFVPADKGFLPQVRAAAERIERYMTEHGRAAVEDFIDDCEALAFNSPLDQLGERYREREPEFTPLPYDELFPTETAARRARVDAERGAWQRRFPRSPERDLLGFLMKHSAYLEDWQRDVAGIVRGEYAYFVPQLRTKLMNEGFATFVHHRIGQALLLETADFVEFERLHASVAQPHAFRPNPYHLGWIMFEELERIARAPTDEERERWPWAGAAGPLEKVLEVVEGYDDAAFLREFLTPSVCERARLFAWEREAGAAERIRITSREADEVRARLVLDSTGLGLPVVEIVDADGLGQGQLWLEHRHEGIGLDEEYAAGTLRHLTNIWGRPAVVVSIAGRDEKARRWYRVTPGEGQMAIYGEPPGRDGEAVHVKTVPL